MQYRPRPNLPIEHLAQMKPVKYKTRDGLTIHGYLTVPKGVKAKNLPVVIHPHGGPWARDIWGYDPEVQFLANRGYAVFQPNFRASTGYGKEFFNAGKKQWGIGDAARHHRRRQVPHRRGYRRPGEGRHLRRLVRRLRDAGRPGLHARPVRLRHLLRRRLEHAHLAQVDPGVLGDGRGSSSTSGSAIPRIPRTWSGSEAVAALLGRPDHGSAARGPGRQRPARRTRPSPTRSSSRCATSAATSSTWSRRTRDTGSATRTTAWRCRSRWRSSSPSISADASRRT